MILDFLIREDGTDRLPRNVSKIYHSTLCNITEQTGQEERKLQNSDYASGITAWVHIFTASESPRPFLHAMQLPRTHGQKPPGIMCRNG
jgi:hypothetical protein